MCFWKFKHTVLELLGQIKRTQLTILEREIQMAGELELLQTKVDEQTVELSETHAAADLAVAKIAELRQAVLDNINDPAKLQAMIDQLDAGKLEADAIQDELKTAVDDNPPAPVE